MAEYGITFARSARKELEGLDITLVGRIFPKIKALAAEPRPAGCRKLQGENIYGVSAWGIIVSSTPSMIDGRL